MTTLKLIIAAPQAQLLEQLNAIGELYVSDNVRQEISEIAHTAVELYDKVRSVQPDLIIADESLFSSSLNLICEHIDVVLLTDDRKKCDVGNIRYCYLPLQLIAMVKKLSKIYSEVTEEEMEEERNKRLLDLNQFSEHFSEAQDQKWHQPDMSFIAERKFNRNSLNSSTSDSQYQFYSDGILSLMHETMKGTVDATNRTIKQIYWIKQPNKQIYQVGEHIDPTGGEVGVVYQDNSKETVYITDKNILNQDVMEKDTKEIPIVVYGCQLLMEVELEQDLLDQLFVLNPCKTNYEEGELPDISRLALYGRWKDGKVKQIDTPIYEKRALTEQDKELIFRYGGKEVSVPITVQKKEEKGPAIAISVQAMPQRTEYPAGFKDLDLTGGKIGVLYQNGSSEQLSMTQNPELSYEVNHDREGVNPVTLTWHDLSTVFMIQIRPPKVIKLVVEKNPNKTRYLDHEFFDPTGMVLKATYDNGTTKTIADYEGEKKQVHEGDYVFPIYMDGVSAPVMIQVDPSEPVVAMIIKTPPDKLDYKEGEEKLDFTGCTLCQIDQRGAEHPVSPKDCKVIGYTPNKVGEQTIILSKNGMSCTYTVQVHEKKLESIRIKTPMLKKTYYEGDRLYFDGLRILAIYDNGAELEVEDYTVDKEVADPSDPKITFQYGDQTISTSLNVIPKQVSAIKMIKLPNKVNYVELKDEFDPTGGEVEVTYNTGAVELKPLTSDMVKHFSNAVPGTFSLDVVIGTVRTDLPITVSAKVLIGISIDKEPNKVDYQEGETFDPEGMSVMAIYSNGQMLPIETYQFAPDGPLQASDQGVIIFYMDKSTAVKVNVEAVEKEPEPEPEPEVSTQETVVLEPETPEDVLQKPIIFDQPKMPEGRVLFYPSTSGLRFDID